MAKFLRLKQKRGYLDCLKFFQATLSGGGNRGMSSSDKRKKIKPQNPDIDGSKSRLNLHEDFCEEAKQVPNTYQDITNQNKAAMDDIHLAESQL
jgi:hypothetical protein